MSTERTEGPWETSAGGTSIHSTNRGSDFIAAVNTGFRVERARANAAFIVRACNSHDDLLAACQAAVSLRHAAEQYAAGNPKFPWIVIRDLLAEWCDLHDEAIKKATAE